MIYSDDDDDAGDFSAHALQQLSLYSLQGNIESDYDADALDFGSHPCLAPEPRYSPETAPRGGLLHVGSG